MAPIKPGISVQYREDCTIIAFTSEKILEPLQIKNLEDSIFPVIEQASQTVIILDFGNVSFLSSAVLGLLIRVSKKICENTSELRLCNIKPKIYEIFKITRLDEIFQIYDDVDAAIQGDEDEK